jgi:hypothetical protein
VLLTQLLQNLTGNGIKFCKATPVIHVRAVHSGEEEGRGSTFFLTIPLSGTSQRAGSGVAAQKEAWPWLENPRQKSKAEIQEIGPHRLALPCTAPIALKSTSGKNLLPAITFVEQRRAHFVFRWGVNLLIGRMCTDVLLGDGKTRARRERKCNTKAHCSPTCKSAFRCTLIVERSAPSYPQAIQWRLLHPGSSLQA